MVINRIAAPGSFIAFKQWHNTFALHIRWCGDTGNFKESLGEVEVLYHLVVCNARLNHIRPANEQWSKERFVVDKTFIEPAVDVPDQFKSLVRRAKKQLLKELNENLLKSFNEFVTALNEGKALDILEDLGDDLEDAYHDAR